MATYKGIQGFAIQNVTSDPTTVGQVWYNSTDQVFKYYTGVATPASWATGATLPTGQTRAAGAGTQTAGLIFGNSPSPVPDSLTQEYTDGAWAAGGNLNTGRFNLGGCGLQTAALAFGGFIDGASPTKATEEYNGASWTSANDMVRPGSDTRYVAGTGTQTAGLAVGGSPSPVGSTEEYDGTNWTAGGNLGTARNAAAAAMMDQLGLVVELWEQVDII